MLKKGMLLALLLCGLAFAGPPTGFEGIPFGTSKSQVIETLMKRGLDVQGIAAGSRIEIPMFQLRDLPVAATLLFNSKQQLYGFQIKTGAKVSDRYFKVIEAAKYMTDLFSQRYGAPTTTYHPRKEQIKPNAAYRKWVFSNAEVIILLHRRSVDGSYNVMGFAGNKKLAQVK